MKLIKELDLDFDDSRFDLYVVVDTTTNIEVSPVLQMRNDCVAVEAFKRMLEEQKEKKAAYSHYMLVNVGTYNCVEHKMECGDYYIVCAEHDDVEKYFNDIVEYIKSLPGEEKE